MPEEKRKNVCTVDHANKQSDALDFNPYEYWRKQAEWLKAVRQGESITGFRRDRTRYNGP